MPKTHDPTSPAHYARLKPEPIDVIAAWRLNFNLGSVVKYLVRAGVKVQPGKTTLESEIEDLEKARVYLTHEIQRLRG